MATAGKTLCIMKSLEKKIVIASVVFAALITSVLVGGTLYAKYKWKKQINKYSDQQ